MIYIYYTYILCIYVINELLSYSMFMYVGIAVDIRMCICVHDLFFIFRPCMQPRFNRMGMQSCRDAHPFKKLRFV